MKALQLHNTYNQDHFEEIKQLILDESKDAVHLKNLTGSSVSFFASGLIAQQARTYLFIARDEESASYLHNDLKNILTQSQKSRKILLYPSSYRRTRSVSKTHHENIVLKTDVLNALNQIHDKALSRSMVIISYPDALMEKVVSKKKLKQDTFSIEQGDKISQDFLLEFFETYEFQRVDFVYEPGQFSVRGSIIDVFSFSLEYPIRIDFFGDEIESIRTFNIEDQRSLENITQVNIIPNTQEMSLEVTREIFSEYLPENAMVWCDDFNALKDDLNKRFDQIPSDSFLSDDEPFQLSDKQRQDQFTTGHHLMEHINRFKRIEFSNSTFFKADHTFEFETSKQPSFNKNFELLIEDLKHRQAQGYQNLILSEQQNQMERLKSIFENLNAQLEYMPINSVVHEGFIDHQLKISVYTDHQIFDRYYKYKPAKQFKRKEALNIQEFNQLKPGDYVVHIDHGVGKFGGLERIEHNGAVQEHIKLVYRDNDVLFVSIHALHKISKFKGSETTPPKINKLGTGAWQKLKSSTKRKVKDIAKELIALYAKRKNERGYAFSADSYLQHELEASFIYEDTEDQVKATKAVKEHMENILPMDLLVCGDVGFGKTEIAIRAAFKAIADNKQVAILVPTTILAFQHFKTFQKRLEDFPANIGYISRNKSRKQQTQLLKDLQEGKVDIIIGTHRLVGKDVKFKDLGLLIVDEEQKFGVSVKEKLKGLKTNVDTLTLTATPIPRTMQFSLMGARDLAVLKTPPPNRYPVVTEIHPFNEDIIKETIEFEVARGGQVFFINNRIQNIYEVERLINNLLPKVNTVVGHGQMKGDDLENLMLDFINGEYDVLIATTIVESGLDIPNVNTIIVNDAQNFGLSELHQLRGRVGRSNKKAFCYLLAPPPSVLSQEAKRRLKAIEEFSELGSGFNIAMQDLDIRGAGNLLGGEQSGFIADIGFEAYHQILDEAIQELKEGEFKDLYTEQNDPQQLKEQRSFIRDCQIDTDLEILFPADYISNIAERIKLYRELDSMQDADQLQAFEQKIEDRFGKAPENVKALFEVVKLRWVAIELGFETIRLKNKKLILSFVLNQESDYYKSALFQNILQYIQSKPTKFRMKQNAQKLSIIAEELDNIQEVLTILTEMKQFHEFAH